MFLPDLNIFAHPDIYQSDSPQHPPLTCLKMFNPTISLQIRRNLVNFVKLFRRDTEAARVDSPSPAIPFISSIS